MSYATAASRGRRQAPALNPLRHLAHLQGFSLLMDLKSVRSTYSRQERYDFVIKDLGLAAGGVLSIFPDHITQQVVLTVESEEEYSKALERLQEGVPWAAAEGAPVYGSAANEAVSAVRVSNIPVGLPLTSILAHLRKFGSVLTHHMGRDRLFPRASDGILHTTMVVNDSEVLPHFIQVVDSQGRLSNSLPIHMDTPRRRCYRCGRDNHFGGRCQAASRASDAPDTIWSTMEAPPPPVKAVAATRAAQAAGEAADGAAGPVTGQVASGAQSSPPSHCISQPMNTGTTAETQTQQPAKTAAVQREIGGRKRPFEPLSSSQASSSSDGERAASPSGPGDDTDMTVVVRGRTKKKRAAKAAREAAAAAKEASSSAGAEERPEVPLATPIPAPSSLEKMILTPQVEDSSGNGGDGGGE